MSGAQTQEAQLVTAAKEEAQAALQLANEAEKISDKTTDPAKKQKLKAAINEVKACSARVIECAELVALNPKDQAAQQKLAAAQKDLGAAIQKVIELTSADQDKEVKDAMNDLKAQGAATVSDQNLLKAAQDVLDEIANTFANPNKKMDAQQVIESAKLLSAKAADLAKQLKEMAERTNDPVFKEKLLTAAKIIRDNSIQVKILSAVRAAGGEDKSNSVYMQSKLLQNNIASIIKEVQAETLRNKFRSTVKQTIAINKVVNVWKTKAKK